MRRSTRGADGDDWDGYAPAKGKKKGKKGKAKSSSCLLPTERRLMWLAIKDADAYVTTKGGAILEGEDFLLDEHGHVYQYDISTDLCLPSAETQAFTGTGMPMRYDPDCASVEYVID